MKNSSWKIAESLPGNYTQLRLFPPTQHEIYMARITELEAKLERQRKGQFGEIGRSKKRIKELEERLEILERGLCKGDIVKKDCEIFSMAIG